MSTERTPIKDCWDEIVEGDILGLGELSDSNYIVESIEPEKIRVRRLDVVKGMYCTYNKSDQEFASPTHYRFGGKERRKIINKYLFSI